MSRNQAQINFLLRKSLSGDLIDTQYYLFSARSKCEGAATKPQALFANDEALAASSEYFSSLLSEKSLNDPALVELQDYHACEEAISLNDYGYASDSDLDEEGEGASATVLQGNEKLELEANVLKRSQRIIPTRRILVTDTAFKTWQALLYYLYTGEIVFAPLRSQPNRTATSGSLDTLPPCSPKSMYRLACKIKHAELQDKSFVAIRSSLTEHNVIQELSSSPASRFPHILEMEVESLFEHVTTPAVKKDYPTLIKRIAGADLPHGADVLIQLHEKMLNQHYPRTVSPSPSTPSSHAYVLVRGR
ncbi:hypothetical protein K503DRAFT_801651 [Rhizopogon vinicolor AM-OR11-026]|uniref:BTB domain-containing protein n=1 Tax=Rhizopogon vinicolor AM-OR11-026 TaxID=1314800 RepID=A0A1B7MWC5_9AGAM|nr:hypothetical protein K503DRAFT_801651 [Rhizopogon vinicolor AM-OR11-026]